MTEPAVVVQKAYDWSLWIVPKVEKFPKSYRFSIGQSLVTASTELLLNLVDATFEQHAQVVAAEPRLNGWVPPMFGAAPGVPCAYQARNAGSLAAAVREVNRVRYLARLAKDLHAITVENHEFAAKAMDEIGRMTGGWLKSTRQRHETPA